MSSVAEETMIASCQILILNSDHAQNHSHQNLLTAHTLRKMKHFTTQHCRNIEISIKENNASNVDISENTF